MWSSSATWYRPLVTIFGLLSVIFLGGNICALFLLPGRYQLWCYFECFFLLSQYWFNLGSNVPQRRSLMNLFCFYIHAACWSFLLSLQLAPYLSAVFGSHLYSFS